MVIVKQETDGKGGWEVNRLSINVSPKRVSPPNISGLQHTL